MLMAATGSGGGAVSDAAVAGGCCLMKGRAAAKAAGVRIRRLVCGRCRLYNLSPQDPRYGCRRRGERPLRLASLGGAYRSPGGGHRTLRRHGGALLACGRSRHAPAGDPGLDARSRRVRRSPGDGAAGRGVVRAEELARAARRYGGRQGPSPEQAEASISRAPGRSPCHVFRAGGAGRTRNSNSA